MQALPRAKEYLCRDNLWPWPGPPLIDSVKCEDAAMVLKGNSHQ